MRLTVRTLLAWIDGVLGPEDQKDLGEKVAASDVAGRLIERANSVVAHPELSAPRPEGRGLADDPDTAAEFLDNVLGAEPLQAFERVCIESDIHLAEVAACHRLLAEMTANPQVIEPLEAGQRRMLLAVIAKHVSGGMTARESALPTGAARLRTTPAPAAAGEPRRPSRRAPLTAWISAAAALGLLLLLGGFFVWSLTRGGGRRGPKPTEIAAVPAVPERPPEPPASKPAAPVEAVAVAEPPIQEAAVAGEIPDQPPPTPPEIRTEPPAAAPMEQPPEPPAVAAAEPPPSLPPVDDRRVPDGDALAIVAAPALPTVPPVAAPGAPEQDPPPAPPPAFDAGTVGGAGLLLHLVDGEKMPRWRPLVAGDTLTERENLLAPAWCHPQFTINGITIRLEPDTRAVLTRDPDGTPRIEIVFGRAVVEGAAADAKLGVTAGGLCGVLSGVMRQPAGIEVALSRDPGGDDSSAEPLRRATIFAGAAEKVWRQTDAGGGADEPLAGIPGELLVAPRATLGWDNRDPAVGVVGPPPVDPPWMRGTAANGRIAREAARTLVGLFATDPGGDAEKVLRGMAADQRSENRMVAAATLALLGDYDQLVALLCDDSRRGMLNEAQWTTLEEMTVPLALARGENAAAKFGEALKKCGPAGKGDLLLRLARGFDDDELAAGGDALLVESLDDGSLAVRRYAIRRLIEIVQPDARHRLGYRADWSPVIRKDGITWWKAQLDQGRIRRGPAPAGSAPPATPPPAEPDDD